MSKPPLHAGVSLKYLSSLPVPPDADFSVVCTYIKTLTENYPMGCRSLVYHLLQSPETLHFVKPTADYFVSYAWKGKFETTTEALASKFETDVFVWMDVLCVDQWEAAQVPIEFDSWCTTFSVQLKAIQRAILVLTPGVQPIAISRAWCVFEWITLVQNDIPFEFCVHRNDQEELQHEMRRGKMGRDAWLSIFSRIDVERAEAFKPYDREEILLLCRRVGVKKVNDIVMNSVKSWLVSVAENALKDKKDLPTREEYFVLDSRAALHYVLGEFDAALDFYQRALECCRQIGIDSFDRLLLATSVNNLAECTQTVHGNQAAEHLYREALDIKTVLDSQQDPSQSPPNPALTFSLALAKYNLASCIMDTPEKTNEALELFGQAQALAMETVGEEHAFVSTCIGARAMAFKNLGQIDACYDLLTDSLERKKRQLGPMHPHVAADLNNLALVLQDCDRFSEAEHVFVDTLNMKRKLFGDAHFEVALTLENLVQLFRAQHREEEAALGYKELATIYAHLKDQTKESLALNNAGKTLLALHQVKESELLLRQALDIREVLFAGQNAVNLAWSRHNMALVYNMQEERKTEAQELGRSAMEMLKRCGVDDENYMMVETTRMWGG